MDKKVRRKEARPAFLYFGTSFFSTYYYACFLRTTLQKGHKRHMVLHPKHFLVIKDQENITFLLRVNYLKSIISKCLKISEKI